MAPSRRPRPTAFREREFHAWLVRHLPAGRSGVLPIGDDAAALRPPPGAVAVLTTDTLVEGTHFRRRSPPRAIGRAATAVSLSDLAAKGATPAGVLFSLILPPSTPPRWAQEVVLGGERAAAAYGAHLVGGDTKAGAVRSVVSTAVGWGRPGRLAPHSGARPGDRLVTTGSVGRGGAAFERWRASSSGRRSAALRALLDVRPRVREGVLLARSAHAMLDTSDGLAEGCRRLAVASRVRLVVDERRLPLVPELASARVSPARRRRLAFYGGDYELIAAIPPGRVGPAVRGVRRIGGRLTVIGSVERGRGAVLLAGGAELPMPAAGWDPFGRPSRAGEAR